MKSLILTPVGYPLRGEESTPFLTTDDPSLFQHYARSQWVGTIVREGNYLFDSLLFPDYAFQAISVDPAESQITEETKISLFLENTPEPPMTHHLEKIRFQDIIGQENAKGKSKIIAKFMSSKELIQSPWAPRNVLFWGPPGNGKTMMAKAVANETKQNMFLIKASDLLGVYVGDGARKIRNLYTEARKNAPTIVFIDELDAIGLKRNYQSIRGDVVELVSALLGEMDGIEKNQGVVTIGATNQPKILDSAILSRFEELIEFKLPNTEERYELLRSYSNTSPIEFHNIRWEEIVQKTQGWSGRDLKEKIIKSAVHYAILKEKSSLSHDDLLKILRKSNILDESLTHYS
jgi:AAA family ATPase